MHDASVMPEVAMMKFTANPNQFELIVKDSTIYDHCSSKVQLYFPSFDHDHLCL